MLNIARVTVMPANPAANTVYLVPDGSTGLVVTVTGNDGAVLKSTKTAASIQAAVDTASATQAANLAAAVTAQHTYADGKALAALTDGKAYTDAREAIIRSDLTAVDNSIRSDFAAGDVASVAAAKTYTDALIASAGSASTTNIANALATANTYTDTQVANEAALRLAGDQSNFNQLTQNYIEADDLIRDDVNNQINTAISTAQGYTDSAIATATTDINATTDTKVATAIAALDQSNVAVYAANIAARDALVLTKTSFVMVADATGDATVNSGAALYFYNKVGSTYTKIAEYESMDLTIPNLNILADFSDIGGLLGYKGTLVATVQHTGSEW